jgi:CRISPR-associated protein Cmr1
VKTIEASFEIVTPMFISGADDVADLRPPSIKGALRFWWRALHWGQYLQEAGNEKEALKQLYKVEAELFGAAVKDQQYGQGTFFIKLKNVEHKGTEKNWPTNNDPGAGYLGFGLDKTRDQAHRQALLPAKFSLCLVLKKASDEQVSQLKNTLEAWGLLGGLGSRSRRGYGSVALIEMDKESYQFKDKASYYQQINRLINKITLSPPVPIFTAFNKGMKISSSVRQHKEYIKLMDDLGRQYKTERLENKLSDRVVYGLPLMKQDDNNRRSSPLFFHVHKLGSGHMGIFSFIPAKFHPEYDQNKIDPLFKSVTNFMDNMESIYP